MTLNEADIARNAGQYRNALDLYRSVLSETPENASAHEGLAVCLSNLKDYAGALKSASRALELDSSLVIPHAVLADVYHHQKRFDEADAEISRVIELQPTSPRAIYVQGVSLLRKDKFEEAIDSFEKTIATEPDLSIAYGSHVNLGYIYQRRREFKKALQEYRFAYKLRPSRGLLFNIWLVKSPWVISIILVISSFAVLGLSIVLDNGLLLALFFLPMFLMTLGMIVRYIKLKRYLWLLLAVFASLALGRLIYGILYVYFTE